MRGGLAEVTAPLRHDLVGYLERKLATCDRKTMSAMTTRLKHFGVFPTETDPTLSSVRDLDRRRHVDLFHTVREQTASRFTSHDQTEHQRQPCQPTQASQYETYRRFTRGILAIDPTSDGNAVSAILDDDLHRHFGLLDTLS